MNNTKLEKKIVSLIPSKTMQRAIKATKHKFTDMELVQIILEFSPSWQDMMVLLVEAKKYIEDRKIKSYITKHINLEKKSYKLLVRPEEGYVYDVIISEMERYLVPDFQSVFVTIDNYLKRYKKYGDIGEIEVIKRKISSRPSSRDIDNKDDPVSCILNAKKQIRVIYSDLPYPDFDKLDIQDNPILYPQVFNAGDLIYIDLAKCPHMRPYRYFSYYSDIEDNKMYGINSFDNSDQSRESDVCCFLKLSSTHVIYRDIKIDEDGFCDYLMSHDHIDFGYIEKADLQTLPEQIKKDYEYAKQQLIALEILK